MAYPAASILYNARILTMDNGLEANSVAVGHDGRIVAVGSRADIEVLAGPGTKRVDLNGRVLLPGFFDCHMHILPLGFHLGQVNISTPPAHDFADVVRLLQERLAANPDAPCVLGAGYDQNKLRERRHMTRRELDAVATHIPVRIEHTSGHAAVVNSRALELLGTDRNTPNPTGGEIERDENGEPTGLLLETASWSNLNRILPDLTLNEKIEALRRASDHLLAYGITSATDANTKLEEIEIYAQAAGDGALQVRTNLMVAWAEVMSAYGDGMVPVPSDLQPAWGGVDGHQVHVGQAKLFSDGAITTRTCWLTEPFENMPSNFGMPLHPPDELRHYIMQAHRAGWQIATHAIGDRAIDLVLSAYADAQRAHPRQRPDHRIEHCMLLNDDLIARLRRQNVWSIGQPEFLSNLGDAYVMALGDERASRLSPYATLDDRGVAQAFSSDSPVVPGAPMDGIRAAVERRTISGRVLNPAECMTPESALYAYTAAPAFATRTERDRGTISRGKWADFVVLSHHPGQMNVREWDGICVDATYVAGECLYTRE